MLWLGKHKFSHIEVAPGGQTIGFGDYNTEGRTYFVNNITGNSNNDGLSWGNALAQISEAITKSEAFRASLATNNQHIRNRIIAQGTATAYTALTSLPHYCDIIGLGADPRGNGAGIVRVGADSGVSDGVDATATVRGLNIYNIQFQAGTGGYAFRGTNFFRCVWDNCVFATNGSPGGAPAAGFSAAICSGNVWKNCHWINASSIGNTNDVGFQITSTHFHNCVVEDCYISGADAAVEIAAACINGYGSIFRRNYIGWGSETCAIGVDDNATAGHIVYAGNYIFATAALDLENNGDGRDPGNYAANAFVAAS